MRKVAGNQKTVKEIQMSKNIFFIGDTHFGHKNILTYCKENRAFNSIEEHDQELIKRWNSRVQDNDEVWVLGDFVFGRKNLDIITPQLKGVKYLVMGNHDMYSTEEYLRYFKKLYGCCSMYDVILSHIPVHECQLEYRFKYNIHGHMHQHRVMTKTHKQVVDSRYINVSCEQINLTPISRDELGIFNSK